MENKICGIYKIENKVNGKIYVGKSVNICKRWNEHKSRLLNGIHKNIYLQNSFNKHRIENFLFEIIEVCDKHVINDREIYWIDKLDSFKNGYNLTSGGEGAFGHKVTEETKEKLRIARIGFTHSEESKKRISEIQKGRLLTDNWKKNISDAHIDNIKSGKFKPKTEHFKEYNDKQKEKIKCYNKDGELIGVYDSIQDAGRILNIQATNICKNLKGKYKTCNGVVFVYFNEDMSKEEINERFSNAFIKNSTKLN